MCGIAGILHYRNDAAIDPETLRAMTRVLAHRGPDGDGHWIDGPVGLGHRRLAIIDLKGGAQPMHDATGTASIIFNGEIYNYQDLMPALEAKGHRFRTRSDTEVILNLHRDSGLDSLERLRGMFAFALWDRSRRRLFLVRDRLGVKPLYYADVGGKLLFGSEVKALLAHPDLPRDIDPDSLAGYLAMGFVPGNGALLRAVRQVPPGHYLEAAPGMEPRLVRWWDFQAALPRTPEGAVGRADSEDILLEALEAHLRETVRLRMVADVPVGAFLSGGIDSSVVVALMAHLSPTPVRTFSIGFDFEEFDERPYARMVAERYGTDHEEMVVSADVREILPRLIWHFDDPFADTSAIPTWRVSEIAARKVTVALSGDGGDEGFAGYMRYVNALNDGYADRMPASLRGLLGTVARMFPDGVRGKNRLRWLSKAGDERYADFFAATPPHLVSRHLSSDWRAAAVDGAERAITEIFEACPFTDPLARMQYFDARMYLPGDILTKVDRASMAHSLEAREPLLDHVVMQFGMNLPRKLRIQAGETKVLLRRLARRLLPGEAIDRPKHGFSVPMDRWLRTDLKELMREVLLGSRTRERGWLDMAGVRRTVDAHQRGARYGATLWALMVLELWARRFLDGPLDPPPAPPPREEFLASLRDTT